MKKIISYFIVLSVFLSTISFAHAAGDYNSAETFAKGIGLITDETYNKDEFITRAEFAGVLSQLSGLNDLDADLKEWQNNNLIEASQDTVNIDIAKRRFKDVDVSHPYYSEIIAVCQKGYMRGISENMFAPEYNLVMSDAVTVFINMLGYSEMAKLNKGIAGSIGLTDGITTPMNEPAKKGDIIKLIHNSLDINVLEIKTNGIDVSYETSKETFMTAVLKMDKIKGVMTDNGYTSFDGESKLTEEQIQVGNIIANVSEDTEYARDFIGHTVEMYYSIKEDEYEVMYVEIAKNDDSITFDIIDFEKFDDNTITYFNGNKNVKKTLADTIYMIYNGEAKTVFDESVFDFESGNVTLVSTNGGNYDLIIITCYEFAVVSSVNLNGETIYNKIKSDNQELNEIDCAIDRTYKKITIKDTAGNNLSLADLMKNDVLNILRNSKNITIIVSKTKVEGYNIKSIAQDDYDKNIIFNGEDSYTVSETYDNYSENVQFTVGNTYAIYLNMFDKIVWVETYAGGENIGILTRARYDEEESEPFREARIYTSGGKLEKIKVAEKIKYNDVNKKFENIVIELEKHYGEAIMYTMDENGIITRITTSETFGTFGNRGWYEIAPEDTYKFNNNDKDLAQMMFYEAGTTTIFTVPKESSDYDDEKAFSANTYSFSDGELVTAVGYSKDKYDVIADVIIIKTDSAGVGAVSGGSDVFVIDKISKGLNADDEAIDILEGWLIDISAKTMSYSKLSVSNECIMVDQKNGYEINPDGDVKYTGPRTYSELERGDVIRYSTDSDKEVYKIRIAFDSSSGSYFNTGQGGYGSDLPLYPGSYEGSTGGSTWAGYALTKSGTGVRVTRGIDKLPSSINLSDANEVKNSLYAFKVNRPDVILVVEKNNNGKISMYRGSIDDLRTYQEFQKNDTTDVLVMFTEWSTATRGTVIYKNFDFKR